MTTAPDPRQIAFGFDLGGTKLLGVALDAGDGSFLAERQMATIAEEERLVASFDELATELITEIAARDGRRPQLRAAGLGAPGLVDRHGVLRYGANLPGVLDAPLAERLAERIGVPVAADNDATCAAWAEHRVGAAVGYRNSITITLGTGIGAGLIVEGALLRGANGFAGEPGHMVIDPSGPRCACGRRGCWEQFGSGTALGRLGREAAAAGRAEQILAAAGGTVAAVTGVHVSDAALAGEPDALAIIEGFAYHVAVGIANLVDLLDVEIVVLSGGLIALGEVLLEPVRRHTRPQVYGAESRPEVPIVPAALGPRSGAIGAALLGLDRAGEL